MLMLAKLDQLQAIYGPNKTQITLAFSAIFSLSRFVIHCCCDSLFFYLAVVSSKCFLEGSSTSFPGSFTLLSSCVLLKICTGTLVGCTQVFSEFRRAGSEWKSSGSSSQKSLFPFYFACVYERSYWTRLVNKFEFITLLDTDSHVMLCPPQYFLTPSSNQYIQQQCSRTRMFLPYSKHEFT